MRLDDCIKKIERYLNSDDFSPRLVNIQNKDDLSAIIQKFSVGSNEFLNIASYAHEDENPKLDYLQMDLTVKTGNLFLTGLTSCLKLQGETILSKELYHFASQTYNAHVVILCFQCGKYLSFRDSRTARLVYQIDRTKTMPPHIIFTLPQFSLPGDVVSTDGIQNIAFMLEETDTHLLYVRTKKHKSDYPNALFYIEEQSSAYDALKNIDISTNNLNKAFGTEEQWNYALTEINQTGSWEALIHNQFSNPFNLDLFIGNWTIFSPNKRWLYFIAMKLYGAGNNWCLAKAIAQTDNIGRLLRYIYRSLLDISPSDSSFWVKYDERKALISSIGKADEEVLDYLQILTSKGADALYYLTDGSRLEKEHIFKLFDQYSKRFNQTEILELLSHIYPDLYDYLQPFQFNNETLNKYFQDYKYQKIINKIYPEFLGIVNRQATRRDFNLWLPPRSEKIATLDKSNVRLYFVDSLGAEYLGFILAHCKNMNLMAKISVCHCELPSITKFNKSFLNEFSSIASNIKRLDEIKHHGEESFDYEHTKLPIHLIRELEIIDEILADIRNHLANDTMTRAYIISDHGASRLAVINEMENQ